MTYFLFWYQLVSINEKSHNDLFHVIYLLCVLYFKALHKHPWNENVGCLMSEMEKPVAGRNGQKQPTMTKESSKKFSLDLLKRNLIL